MDLYAARTHLGLPERFDRDTARRAYLRRVKACKPERDPEGFQRTRAAWEAVDEALRDRPWVFGHTAAADGAEDDDPDRLERGEDRHCPPIDLDALLEELDAAVPPAEPAPVAAAPQPVAAVHVDPPPEPLPELAPFPHGAPPGDPGPSQQPKVDKAHLRRVFERGVADRPVVETHDLARALDIARDLPDAPRPQVDRCVRTVADLLQQGHRPSAERLARALAGWIDAHGGELKVFRSTEAMLRWHVTRETALAARSLQRPVFALLLQAEHLSKADLQPVVDRWLDDHLDRVPVALLMLRMHCPVAAQTLVAALQKGWDQRRPGQVALPLSTPTQPWRLPVPPPPKSTLAGNLWVLIVLGSVAATFARTIVFDRLKPAPAPVFDWKPKDPFDRLDRARLLGDLAVPPTPVAVADLSLRHPLAPLPPPLPTPALLPWRAEPGWPSDLPAACGTAPAGGESAARHVRKHADALALFADPATAAVVRAQGRKVAQALRARQCARAAWETATLVRALAGDADAADTAAPLRPNEGEPGCGIVAAVQACRSALPTKKSGK